MAMIKLTEKCPSPRPHDATLTLPWEQRTRSRLRVVLDDGREAGLFLARGTILRGDDLLVSEDGIVVKVRAAKEPLSIATSDDPLLTARVCYHLGNRHTLLDIRPGRIHYLQDPVLDRMVQGFGLPVHWENGPFEPEVGAYTDGGHRHG